MQVLERGSEPEFRVETALQAWLLVIPDLSAQGRDCFFLRHSAVYLRNHSDARARFLQGSQEPKHEAAVSAYLSHTRFLLLSPSLSCCFFLSLSITFFFFLSKQARKQTKNVGLQNVAVAFTEWCWGDGSVSQLIGFQA